MRRGLEWPDAEYAVVEELYPTGGGRAVKQVLPHRSMASIKNTASRIGVEYIGPRGKKNPEPAVTVPRMDLLESLDCIRLRNWGGPVNRDVPMRWVA